MVLLRTQERREHAARLTLETRRRRRTAPSLLANGAPVTDQPGHSNTGDHAAILPSGGEAPRRPGRQADPRISESPNRATALPCTRAAGERREQNDP